MRSLQTYLFTSRMELLLGYNYNINGLYRYSVFDTILAY